MTYFKSFSALFLFLSIGFSSLAQKQEKIVSKLEDTPSISVTEQDQKIMGDNGTAHTVSIVAEADAVMDQ